MYRKIIILISLTTIILIAGCINKAEEPVDNTRSCCMTCISGGYNSSDELCTDRFYGDKDMRGCNSIFRNNNFTVNDCLKIIK